MALFDRHAQSRLDAYLERAGQALQGVEAAMGGLYFDWVGSDPEGKTQDGDQGADRRAGQDVARVVQPQHHA